MNSDNKTDAAVQSTGLAGVAGSVPGFTKLEEMVAWYEAQPQGTYELLWGSDGARITLPHPPYTTVAFVADVRAASVLWEGLKAMCESAISPNTEVSHE